MKEFLNLLEQSIAILDENKRLIGLNKAALQYLGYENMLLNIELCGLEVKADKVCLSILNNQGEYTQGSMHIERSSMEGEGCWLGIIQWEERLEKQQTAELIEAFLEHIDQSICIKDKKGNYVYCNKHYRERINAPKNIIGTRDEDYWGKQYSDAFKESDDYVLENYKQCSIEEEVLEEEKYFETIKFPVVKDEDFYIGIIIKDITIQKVLYNQRVDEQTCMDKGKKLSGILTGIKEYFKTSSVNIWIYDEEKEVLGPCFNIDYIKNLMGEQMWIPMSKEMAIVIKTKGEAIIRTNKFPLSTNEEEVDETKPIFYVIYYPIVYRGNLVGVLNIIVDEEPKKFVVKNYFMNSICQQIGIMLAEQKMKQALENECVQRTNCEENLNKLLEITVDIIIRVDEQGYFKWVSQEGMQILGWSEEALLKLRWQDIIHPEDYDKIQDRMSTWEGEGEIGTCVTRCCCKNGTYKWLRWQGCYQEKGGLYVATAKDITREVELEAKENLAKDALQIEKLKGEFFANLSHEFRTPLTIIISALQMLEGVIEEEIAKIATTKYVGAIRQNSYRLLRLVNNLIDVTKIDAGYYELQIHNYNIVYVIEEIVMSVADYAHNQDVEIIFDTEIEEEIIACDPDKIERIILNLLSNAIKYTVEAGKIQVYIRREEEEVIISVEDNGIGMPEEKIPYIFERFIQIGEVLTRRCEGSGIGLAIVKSLVELHGGRIDVASEVGKGTRFEIRLPRLQKDEEGCVVEMINSKPINQMHIEKCQVEFSDIYKR